MAHLGNIGVRVATAAKARAPVVWNLSRTTPVFGGRLARRLPVWAESAQYPLLTANLAGHYSGIVTQEGVPVAGHRVSLFWRSPIKLIESKLSGVDGSFNFTELIPGTDNYFIVIFDKLGAPVQNMLAFDNVTPVV